MPSDSDTPKLTARQRWARAREYRLEHKQGKPRMKKLRFAFVIAGLSLLATVSWVFGVMMAVAQDLPDLESRAQYDRAKNSVVLDRDGEQVATLTGNERRILLRSEEISPLMKDAIVSIEDERFYEHRGIDFMGVGRALKEDIASGSAVQGGSTITQQFVKNALEAQQSRTVLQKLRESALAYQIERKWSKDKILTNYLNNIYFGEGAYGVEAAARTFFGDNHPGCGEEGNRCASQLTVEEAAMLAGVVSSPDMFSPRNDPDAARERRNLVLEKMRELGKLELPDEEFQELKDFAIPAPSRIEPPQEPSDAPYFTDWVRQQVVDRYGAGQTFGGGLQIKSTIDMDLQEAAETAVAGRLDGLGPTAAVVAIDNSSGEVLAMVGGDDFQKSSFNLATNGRRQPGSSFKPFTLVTALSEGRSLDDVVTSQPIDLPFENTSKTKGGKKKTSTEVFEVSNYEDSYLGTTTLLNGTTYSDNSIYAQVGLEAGTDDIAATAEKMGIESRLGRNPAMILGGLKRGVTPLEMAYAYTTLANRGEKVSGTLGSRGNGSGPVGLEKVETAKGELLEDDLGASGKNEETEERVIDEEVAEDAVGALRTVVETGTGTRAQVGSEYIFGKTGTTDNNVDAWFVGASDEITIAVWVGYAEGSQPMETEFGGAPVDGGTIPALIWNEVFSAYLEQNPPEVDTDGEFTDPTTGSEVAPPTAPVTPSAPAPVEEVAPEPEQAPEPAPEAPAPEPAPTPAPPAGGGGGAPPASGGDGAAGPAE
ncbi:MAG: transglycosylase domain-containing protein [Solirubrobacterales bacterium]